MNKALTPFPRAQKLKDKTEDGIKHIQTFKENFLPQGQLLASTVGHSLGK